LLITNTPSTAACRAAVLMKRREAELNERFLADRITPNPLLTRIGINTGDMVGGNMGTEKKMDYTVIGDDVNLAARLESANKELRSHVLISESTYEGCKDLVEVVEHEPMKVKGKEKPVAVYEVVGWKGARAEWARPLSH